MRPSAIIVVGGAVLIAVAAAFGTLLLAFPETALAEEAVGVMGGHAGVVQWGFAAAAASAGLSAAAAGYAVAHVGSAAVGALAEKPELMGRVLVIVGLAEGIAIYGLIVSILILNRLA
jgi:V/A-type H+-transporting ATPase subunit K